jgi:hypothetical protein
VVTKDVCRPDTIVAVNGYRGDKMTRVVLIDRVYDNRIVGLCGTRNEYRSYLFEHMQNVQEVKS